MTIVINLVLTSFDVKTTDFITACHPHYNTVNSILNLHKIAH